MGVEGDGQVVGPTFDKIALAVLGLGVSRQTCGNELLVAIGELPLRGQLELVPAAPAGRVAGGVDLDQERGESNRRKVLGGDDSDVSQVTEEMGCTQPMLGAFELPVHGQAVVHDDPGIALEDAGLFHRLGPPCRRGMDQGVETGGDDVHPDVDRAQPVGGLVGVQHRQAPQQRHEGGDEAFEAPCGFCVDRVDRPCRDLEAEQLRHGFCHPAVRDVLAPEQVGDDGSCSRAVTDRRPHVVGKRPRRLVPAGTSEAVGPVLGRDRLHLGQLDDLAGAVAELIGLTEHLPAVPTALWNVVDDLVGVGGHLKGRALRATLLATAPLRAAGRALGPLVCLALALSRWVARRRQAGVPGVLAESTLELGDAGLQLLDVAELGCERLDLAGLKVDDLCLRHDQPSQLLVRRRSPRLVRHTQSPANSRPNREHSRAANALVTRLFGNCLTAQGLGDLNTYFSTLMAEARALLSSKALLTPAKTTSGSFSKSRFHSASDTHWRWILASSASLGPGVTVLSAWRPG